MTMLTVIIRFPYRLIPKLPPAKLLANVVGVSSDFIDERRKGLVRWLTITTSHPVIKAVWSTLIGRDPTLLRFHWSRASRVMLVPAILCHKEPARASKAPIRNSNSSKQSSTTRWTGLETIDLRFHKSIYLILWSHLEPDSPQVPDISD